MLVRRRGKGASLRETNGRVEVVVVVVVMVVVLVLVQVVAVVAVLAVVCWSLTGRV